MRSYRLPRCDSSGQVMPFTLYKQLSLFPFAGATRLQIDPEDALHVARPGQREGSAALDLPGSLVVEREMGGKWCDFKSESGHSD
jgi:hypothetical protein